MKKPNIGETVRYVMPSGAECDATICCIIDATAGTVNLHATGKGWSSWLPLIPYDEGRKSGTWHR